MATKKGTEQEWGGISKAREEQLKKMGFTRASGSRLPIIPWKKGLEVAGKLVFVKKLPDFEGKTGGHLFHLELPSGEVVCYGAPTILWESLSELPLQSLVVIACTGKVKTRRGQDAWTFDVMAKPAE